MCSGAKTLIGNSRTASCNSCFAIDSCTDLTKLLHLTLLRCRVLSVKDDSVCDIPHQVVVTNKQLK